jgi:hypothetical protein
MHEPRACSKMHCMRLEHVVCAPSILNVRGASVILFVFVGLARVFRYQPSSFRISHSKLWKFKRKATLELPERIYLLLDFLGYVLIFSNLFLVTMCN